MNQEVYQVDAFADAPFMGNPAAVVVRETFLPDALMQQIALEMNLAETAFLARRADGFNLRWFTPTVEVDLCGHATLASAFVLWDMGYLPINVAAYFHTRSGLLTALPSGEGITLDFPAERVVAADTPGLTEALGVKARFVGRNRLDYLVEVDNAETVRRLTPDMGKLAQSGGRGIIVTAASDDPRYDFISRFFAPAAGVPEDPVTGSAHCALAPYWRDNFGRDELVGYQASARGGTVRTECRGDRVMLNGNAILTMTGTLHLP
jgi:PhzF family phenazine biosynthesis protein